MKTKGYWIGLMLGVVMIGSCEEALDLLGDDPRDAFVGEWEVKEDNSLKSSEFYQVTIEKSIDDSTAVLISNFYNISRSTRVKVSVNGSSASISEQTVSGYTFRGNGSIALNDKTINWSYTADHNNGFIDNVTAVYTRSE